MTVKEITLDNIDYIIVSALEINKNKYFILSEEKNPKNIIVRKIVIHESKECLTKLDSVDECETVIKEFYNKYGRGEKNE